MNKKDRRQPLLRSCNKGIGPVIASGLLLVVAIVSIVGFQTWFNNYSSVTFSNVESQSGDSVGSTNIDTISNNFLYFKNSNSENVTIQSVKVGGVDCSVSQEVSNGLTGINISSCLSNLTSRNAEVIVVTNNKVFSKKVYLSDVSLTSSEGSQDSSFSLSIGVNDTSIYYGDYVNVSWNVSNGIASSCIASNGWTGTKSNSSSSEVIQVYTDLNFTMNCSYSGSNYIESINISVYDPYWSSVVLFSEFEGSFTDLSPASNSYTATTVAFDASSKYQSQSIIVEDADQLVTNSDAIDWDFGTGNWTMEGWLYFTGSTGTYDNLFMTTNGGTEYIQLYIDNGNNLYYYDVANGPLHNFGAANSILPLNSWFHLAVVRESNQVTLFVNGTKTGTSITSNGNQPGDRFYLGHHNSLARSWAGKIDSIRITKGIARYTGTSFTTPPAVFPTK